MLKLLSCTVFILRFLDKISYYLLYFVAIAFIFACLGMDFYSIDYGNYDTRLLIAKNNIDYIFAYISILILCFLWRKKYPRILYFEIVLWIGLFFLTPYLIHQISSVEQMNYTVSETGDKK